MQRSFRHSVVSVVAVCAAAAASLLLAPSHGAAAPSAAPSSVASTSSEERTVTLVNQDSAGRPTIRFDVNGEAIDAHDGQIQRFGDTYYLYGTRYDCGYEWNTPGAPFCGFVSYSSPDLVTWTPKGPLYDASTAVWQDRCDGGTYGCYRPHVVFNESTGKYVLWINTYDNGVGYRVLTSDRPDGGFTEVAEPDLGAPEGSPRGVNYGDHQIYVDHDGRAYLSFTDWRVGGDILIEELDETYTTGSGNWTRVNLRATEAPTLFERQGTYYLTYSDPNRGYTTTGTGFVTAPSPLGPWTGVSQSPTPWSVSNGVLEIDGGDVGLSREGAGWTDYTYTATVTPRQARSRDYGQVGMVFRAGATGAYQWLIGNYPHAGAEGGNLTKLVPGQPTVTKKLPMSIVTGQQYVIAITATGNTIETRIDGQLVDTTTASSSSAGRVGFRQGQFDGERVSVERVSVTAPDGSVLLQDEFSAGLAKWEQAEPIITGTNITTTSCGGQPADVLPLETAAGTVYLYQSDVWMNAKANEALAKHYWQPLSFDENGAIEPIECGRSYDVTIPVGPATATPPEAAVSTGDLGYLTHWDVFGAIRRAQSFTVPEDGQLRSVRITSFQTGYPDAGLKLELRRVAADGTIAETVTSTTVAREDVSWAARWVELDLDQPMTVTSGDRFALVMSSDTTKGQYGIAYNDTVPFAGGHAYFSRDGGRTWAIEAGRSLHLEADITVTPPPNTAPTGLPDAYTTEEGKTLTVGAPGVLANDTDAEGDALTATDVTQPINGSVSMASGGGFSYIPDAGFSGRDVFTYQADDGTATSGATRVELTVTRAQPPAVTQSNASAPAFTYGQAGTVEVTVEPSTATGAVTVRNGSTVLGTGTLSGGAATVTLPARSLPPGTHLLNVQYGGDKTHGSSSTSVQVTVNKVTPTMTVDQPVQERGGRMSVKVSLTAPDGVPVTGSVEVWIQGGGTASGIVRSDGTAVVELPRGTRNRGTMTVIYSGSDLANSVRQAVDYRAR